MAMLTLYWILDVALVFLFTFAVAYLYMTRNFGYWRKRGVTEIPPTPFFGNFLDCILFRVSSPKHLQAFHERGEGLPYVGFYIFDKPALLLRDPNIIKNVLIKDFNYFADRYSSTDESDTIGSANPFLLKNPQWKNLRSLVSPIYTSGKLKKMFPLMLEIGENLVTHLDVCKFEGEDDGGVVEVKDTSAKYTIDVITSCAFGLEVDSLNDPESAFKQCGMNMFGFTTYKRAAEFAAFFFAPQLVKLLKLKFFSTEASDFMRKIFMKTMAIRIESNDKRDDLIDLLIQLRSAQHETDDPEAFKLEGDSLVAQAVTFFAAGFETSSTAMAFSLYELALQPDLQSKLRKELMEAVAENKGEVTYEMVMNLPYLDMVVMESLRKYPSLPLLDRVAGYDYEVPETGLKIEKGTPIYVALWGLHYDPQFYPEPEKYDPERFSKENRHKIPPCAYLPFGDGPRNCVGLRFGLLLAKLGVLKFILNCKVSACSQTLIPVRYDPKGFSPLPKGGLYLNVRRIATTTD